MDSHAPKRFTISPGLTITKVRVWGRKTVQNVENAKKSFLNYATFFQGFLVSNGGNISLNNLNKNCMKTDKSGLIKRKI